MHTDSPTEWEGGRGGGRDEVKRREKEGGGEGGRRGGRESRDLEMNKGGNGQGGILTICT